MLMALGVSLLGHNVLPAEHHDSPLHAALLLGAFAAGFGAVYAYAGAGRRFTRLAAIFFGTLAAVALFAAGPWTLWSFGFGVPLWPLLLIGLGVWIVRREGAGLSRGR
jgi:hypothetical protein